MINDILKEIKEIQVFECGICSKVKKSAGDLKEHVLNIHCEHINYIIDYSNELYVTCDDCKKRHDFLDIHMNKKGKYEILNIGRLIIFKDALKGLNAQSNWWKWLEEEIAKQKKWGFI